MLQQTFYNPSQIVCITSTSELFSPKTTSLKIQNFILGILCCLFFFDEAIQAQSEVIRSPQTYALITGISDYEDPAIPTLKYAHRDAQIFAEYLRSENGGNVPDKNITLLQNEQASWSAIYTAMDQISERCEAGDRVFFYFSGHGDIENEKVYKLGFLIAYNTPHVNYINSSLRLEDLNNFANTLSSTKNVQVVIITDACHSGNLHENDFRGSAIVAEQLKSIVKNEVRLTSCRPDELSMENEQWGGGRSVFSYYLVEGLRGLAEFNQDGQIDLGEMDNFLKKSMEDDVILKKEATKQTPVLSGDQKFALGKAKGSDDLQTVENSVWVQGLDTLSSLPMQQNDAFFKLLQNKNRNEVDRMLDGLKFDSIKTKSRAEIPKALLTATIKYFNELQDNYLYSNTIKDLTRLLTTIDSNQQALKRFTTQLVIAISNYTQRVISLYQEGDEAELERRRYYNTLNNSYQTYVDMLAVAMQCADANGRIYTNLYVQQHYFNALVLRLSTFKIANRDSVLKLAELELETAMKQEEYAAYLFQEMGLIDLFQKNAQQAEVNFKLAEQIAPRWALPKAYLAATEILKGDLKKAQQKIDEALVLNPNQSTTLLHAGMLHEELKNYLRAEEYYNQVILINTRHYLPFERLAKVKLKTGEYNLSDSLFREAEQRKKGYLFVANFMDSQINPIGDFMNSGSPEAPCPIPEQPDSNDVISLLFKGDFFLRGKVTSKANDCFKACLKADPNAPLLHYYMAKICWLEKRWLEAEYQMTFAIQQYQTKEALENYAKSKANFIPSEYRTCMQSEFWKLQAPLDDIKYLQADIWIHLNRFEQAAAFYQEKMASKGVSVVPYFLASRLHEQQGKYYDAEKIWSNYYAMMSRENASISHPYELDAFYQRVLKTTQKDISWYYRAGMFASQMALAKQKDPWYEAQMIVDSINARKRSRIDESLVNQTEEWSFTQRSIKVPGTEEILPVSNKPTNPEARCVVFLSAFCKKSNDLPMVTMAYQTMGDVYRHIGATLTASAYYQKAVGLDKTNTDLRLKMMSCFDDNKLGYQYWLQQDTLFANATLPLSELIRYAYSSMLVGNFTRAEEALEQRKLHFPGYDSTWVQAHAFYAYFTEENESAIAQYKSLVKLYPNQTDYLLRLADLHVRTNKTNKALDYLQEAIKKGFKGYYVLNYNPLWQEQRNNHRFKELIKEITPSNL